MNASPTCATAEWVDRRAEWIFPGLLALCGVVYTFAIPPFQVPDETGHLPRAVVAVGLPVGAADGRVIVTENASDFAAVTTCSVLFVRKSWWPASSLASRLATAVERWASANPAPGAQQSLCCSLSGLRERRVGSRVRSRSRSNISRWRTW